MARPIAKVQTPGRHEMLEAASGLNAFALHSFRVGDAAGFAPTTGETNQRGAMVFQGNAALMQTRVLKEGVIRYSVILPEGAGPFDVGNVLLYIQNVQNEIVPLVMLVMPFTVPKALAAFDGDPNYYVPGNRFMLSVTITHELLDVDNDAAVVVEVISPEYSNLAFFENEAKVPAPELNPYGQFILQAHLLTNAPALVTKTDDNRYWANPLLKDMRHPKYNVVDGGISGDGYREQNLHFLWGHRFETADAEYAGNMGGVDFDFPDDTEVFVVGSTF